MRSELGAPTQDEVDLLCLARGMGHLGGVRIESDRLATLATRLVSRGLGELHLSDDGAQRLRITSAGAAHLKQTEKAA